MIKYTSCILIFFVRARVRLRSHGALTKKIMSDMAILSPKTYNSIYIMHFKVFFVCARTRVRAYGACT